MRTIRARVLAILTFTAVFIVAQPASALCVKCVVNECWASSTATAADCYSYGTSCLTTGRCAGGGGICADPGTCPDEDGALAPLNSEYVLTAVAIHRPVPGRALIAANTSPAAFHVRASAAR